MIFPPKLTKITTLFDLVDVGFVTYNDVIKYYTGTTFVDVPVTLLNNYSQLQPATDFGIGFVRIFDQLIYSNGINYIILNPVTYINGSLPLVSEFGIGYVIYDNDLYYSNGVVWSKMSTYIQSCTTQTRPLPRDIGVTHLIVSTELQFSTGYMWIGYQSLPTYTTANKPLASNHPNQFVVIDDELVHSVSGSWISLPSTNPDNSPLLDPDLVAISSLPDTTGFVKKNGPNEWSIESSISGGHATQLDTARNIAITGDATWDVDFDGSADVSAALTLTSVITAGVTNNSATENTPITYDAKGRITSIGSPVTITPSWNSVGSKPTTLSGYGITDAINVNQKDVPNGVAALNENGELVGTIVPRTAPLSVLNTVVGSQGELASPTDVSGIYKFSGTVAGGELIYNNTVAPPDYKLFTTPLVTVGSSSAIYENYAYFASLTPSARSIVVTWSTTARTQAYISNTDGQYWSKLPVCPGNIADMYISTTSLMLKVDTSGVLSYYILNLLSVSSGWLAVTGLHANFGSSTYAITCNGFDTTNGFALRSYDSATTTVIIQDISNITGSVFTVGTAVQHTLTDSSSELLSYLTLPRPALSNVSLLYCKFICIHYNKSTYTYYNFGATTPAINTISLPNTATSSCYISFTDEYMVYLDDHGSLYWATYSISSSGVLSIGTWVLGTSTGLESRTTATNLLFTNNSTVFVVSAIYSPASSLVAIASSPTSPVKLVDDFSTIHSATSYTISNTSYFMLPHGMVRTNGTSVKLITYMSNSGHVQTAANGYMTNSTSTYLTGVPGLYLPVAGSLVSFSKVAPTNNRSLLVSAAGNMTLASNNVVATTITTPSTHVPPIYCIGNSYATAQTSLTVTLPGLPYDASIVCFYFTAAVTTCTIAPNSSNTETTVRGVGTGVSGGGTSLTISNIVPYQLIRFTYFSCTNTWIYG